MHKDTEGFNEKFSCYTLFIDVEYCFINNKKLLVK